MAALAETPIVAPPLIPCSSISLCNIPATALPPAGRRPKIRFQCVNKHVDVRPRYVHVGHEPARIQHLGQDSALLQPGFEWLAMLRWKLREDHIGRVRLDGHLVNLREAGRETGGVVVVFGKTRHVMVERVEARRSQDACLAHAAAQDLAPAVGDVDERLATNQYRPDRRPQALGEADRD